MNEIHIAIVMYPRHISWEIASDGTKIASGADPLTSTNGDYDSLLSNVVNDCYNRVESKNIHFLFRKG